MKVIVIGSGPGGYIAAIRLAQLGMDVTCVEKEKPLGGTCLNVGCIPSKALLHDSYLVKLGVKTELSKMMNRKDDVVKGLTDGVAALFKKHKIERLEGEASFISDKKVRVGQKEVEYDIAIIATGSKPSEIPFLPFEKDLVVSSTGALKFKSPPKNLAVIGGGVIGVELASVWSRMGSKVTVIEMLPEILATMDPAISRTMLSILKKQGITFHLGTKLESAEKEKISLFDEGVRLKFGDETLVADKVLVATGRKPYTEGLGLENVGIKPDERGFIPINDRFQTENPHIYAIGDVIEGPMLAHKASEEGVAAAEIIAGEPSHISYMSIPNVVYTHPEAASVGMTEPEAKATGRKLITGTCSMRAIGRARCQGDTDGFVKVVGDEKTGRLLGLHIVADAASEMIGEGVIALNAKMTIEQLANSSHAHPTLSEGIKEAALAALGRPLNF